MDGGYRFTGRKSFGSLSPVWTYLGIHGIDTADPSKPKIVHAFMPRDTEGLSHRADLGRARHARDAQRRYDPRRRLRPRSLRRPGRARRRRRHRPVRAGPLRVGAPRLRQHLLRPRPPRAGSDDRHGEVEAIDRPHATDGVSRGAAASRSRRWAWRSSRSVRISIASPRTGRTASTTAPRGRQRSSRRSIHAVEESWRIVDLALEVAGGFGIFRKSGLEQLFRDARLGRIHPANSMLTHEIVGEDAARDQPGRNAALGMTAQTNIVGLISSAISEMRSAGSPARRACSRIASMLGASYSQ